MTIRDMARVWGIRLSVIRRTAKRLGIAVQDQRTLSKGDIEALRSVLRPDQDGDTCRLPDSVGLPIEALSEPTMREAFTRLRFEREHRLFELVSRSVTPARHS